MGAPEPCVKHQVLPLICFRTGYKSLCISVPAWKGPSTGKNKGSIILQRANCDQRRAFGRHTCVFTGCISSSTEQKKNKKTTHKCSKQQLGSSSPCPFQFPFPPPPTPPTPHPPPRELPYLPAMPQLPGLAGQAAARLQRALRSAKGNRNSAFHLPAFESCSAETPQGKASAKQGPAQLEDALLNLSLLLPSHLPLERGTGSAWEE